MGQHGSAPTLTRLSPTHTLLKRYAVCLLPMPFAFSLCLLPSPYAFCLLPMPFAFSLCLLPFPYAFCLLPMPLPSPYAFCLLPVRTFKTIFKMVLNMVQDSFENGPRQFCLRRFIKVSWTIFQTFTLKKFSAEPWKLA